MSTWDGNNYYYSGQGVVLIGARDVAGLPAGLIPVGNVSDLKISIATSVLEHKESQTGQRGIDLRLTTETKCSLSMTVENYISSNLALAVRGQETITAAGAVVDIPAGKVYIGKISPLGHAKVSAVVLKKASTTLVAYTNGMADGAWDYKLNADAGSVLWAAVPITAGLLDGDAFLQSYTHVKQSEIAGLVTGSQERYLRFEGLNTANNNSPVIIEVFKFSVDPLKELSMISDSVQQFVLEGSVLADPLRLTGSKYFREVLLT